MRVVAGFLGLALALSPLCPLAQNKVAAPKAAPEPPRPPPETPPAPYEPQLLRLAELMGALAYLRDLCSDADGEQWRQRMSTVIDAEASNPARREKLAGAYNKGFRGYEITYRSCTPNATLVIARFIDEGARLAHEIANRYGGG